MSALSEALVAAQRQAISAASKSFVAALEPDPQAFRDLLDEIGCTDKVEQGQLERALLALRVFGAQAPEPTKPDTSQETASERQVAYIASLANERGVVAPDHALTKEQASKVIEQLKAGTYNADEWVIPF